MAKYGTPPFFSPKFFFYQNDSEWPEMDFKHNFKKYGILSVRPPPWYGKFHTFFSFFLRLPLLQQKSCQGG